MNRRDIFKGAALAATLSLGAAPAMAQEEYTIGVAIPSATHGFMGGLNFHAREAIARLEETYPQLSFVLATSGDAAKMVNDIEDMVATRGIDGTVHAAFRRPVRVGDIVTVKIDRAEAYDLYGSVA